MQPTIRSDFPFFDVDPTVGSAESALVSQSALARQPLVYLDSAATSQKPRVVIETLSRFLSYENANVHRGVYRLAESADARFEEARATVARFINAPGTDDIIFTAGTTASINLIASAWARHNLKAGDVVVTSMLEHHSNLVPWQMLAQERGLELIVLPVTGLGTIDHLSFEAALEQRPKLVALSGMSNVTGVILPVARFVRQAHAAGARIAIDAAQLVAHRPIDVQATGVDFLAFSAHKVYGPTGVGVLYVDAEMREQMNPPQGGGGMVEQVSATGFLTRKAPWGFEAGTPPIAEAIGLAAALKWLEDVGFEAIRISEDALYQKLICGLSSLHGLRVMGIPPDTPLRESFAEKSCLASFVLDGLHPHDAAQMLDECGIAVRAGHHCAMPLHKALCTQLGAPASVRASIGAYTDETDIMALLSALDAIIDKRPSRREG